MASFVVAPPGAMVRQKKLFWWSNDIGVWMTWRHVDALVRTTEDEAFANILAQVRTIQRLGDAWYEFTELEWDCYFTEQEVMKVRRTGSEQPNYTSEIAVSLRMVRADVLAVLDDLSAKMWLRESHDMPALPPIPMQYLQRAKQLERKAA